MDIHEYFSVLLQAVATSSIVTETNLKLVETNLTEGRILGALLLANEHRLHVSEYVITEPVLVRDKYRYHAQDSDGNLIIRWDDAPHHPECDSFPHHCHMASGAIESSQVRSLQDALALLPKFI